MRTDLFRQRYEVKGLTETASLIRSIQYADSPEQAITQAQAEYDAMRWLEKAEFRHAERQEE